MNLWAPGNKTDYYGKERGSLEARPFSNLPALVRVEMNRKADVGGSYPLPSWATAGTGKDAIQIAQGRFLRVGLTAVGYGPGQSSPWKGWPSLISL